MKKVAAVVVTYNRKNLLLKCISHLFNQEYRNFDIVIVDNNSDDGTEEALSKYIQTNSIIYQNTGSNLGGAGGFNWGIKFAAEFGYEYIWVMDDDCMPENTALAAFIDADVHLSGQWGFLSSKVNWRDGSICRMNIQRQTLTRNMTDFSTDIIPIVMASFVSLFIKSNTVYELGLPIKDFYIWTDDWEYTRRISRKYPCYFIGNSCVTHESNQNLGAKIEEVDGERLDRFRYLYRNDVYLYKREGILGVTYEACRLILHSLRVLLRAKDHKKARLFLIIEGTLEGLRFEPVIEFPKRRCEFESLRDFR